MKKHHAQKLVNHFNKAALRDVCEALGDNYEEILAFALGQRVQARNSRSGVWESVSDSPDFADEDIEFRVHPDDASIAYYYVDHCGQVAAKTSKKDEDDESLKDSGNCFRDFESAKHAAHRVRQVFKMLRGFDKIVDEAKIGFSHD